MKSYVWRKNFSAIVANQEMRLRGKLAFKTDNTKWLYTEAPVVIPISLYSSFHEGLDGELKMHAFLSIIKEHVKGRVTLLFAEKAHLKVASLKYQNDQQALEECLKQVQKLTDRFKDDFESCNVVSWDTYICKDSTYPFFHQNIMKRYDTDHQFRSLVHQDAEATYTVQRALEFPNKVLFMSKAIEDILEQSICLLVMTHKGYRFQFYPGQYFASTNYVNNLLIPSDQQISYINVFLTIEKKTILPND